jgi:hypothetical protein
MRDEHLIGCRSIPVWDGEIGCWSRVNHPSHEEPVEPHDGHATWQRRHAKAIGEPCGPLGEERSPLVSRLAHESFDVWKEPEQAIWSDTRADEPFRFVDKVDVDGRHHVEIVVEIHGGDCPRGRGQVDTKHLRTEGLRQGRGSDGAEQIGRYCDTAPARVSLTEESTSSPVPVESFCPPI